MDDMLDRGLDPNFQYSSTGETPLCCATLQPFSKDLILKLVEKGALLEFRDDDGFTPLHRAAICGNLESIKVGSSERIGARYRLMIQT
ncbi:ankyrin repeat protein [Opisthorchis viverrini]|uniref:Ankyrin repeat protein n=1 Tax=Opisthorchis viverrini TaxID=6198 RepID=A0A1S8WVK9_OPIVI|nr:ankyrin repeat protein [Opisthorchis viverrini]